MGLEISWNLYIWGLYCNYISCKYWLKQPSGSTPPTPPRPPFNCSPSLSPIPSLAPGDCPDGNPTMDCWTNPITRKNETPHFYGPEKRWKFPTKPWFLRGCLILGGRDNGCVVSTGLGFIAIPGSMRINMVNTMPPAPMTYHGLQATQILVV